MNLENPFLERKPKPSPGEGIFSRLGALIETSEEKYDLGRGDLEPRVLEYADKLRAEIRGICGKYGTAKVSGLLEGLTSGKIRVVKTDIKQIISILTKLEQTLDEKRIPSPELPPAEAFESMVRNVNERISPLQVYNLGNWDSYQFKDGELTGVVFASSGAYFPVIDGELVDAIKDEQGKSIKFEKCVGTVRIDNGKLNSVVMVGGRLRIVADGVLIDSEIDQKSVHSSLGVIS